MLAFDWNLHFEMPTLDEIEQDLAPGSASWTSLLAKPQTSAEPGATPTRAIVIGGSMAGLLAARVLAEHFDRVTIVDRDRLPSEATFRDGVPQSRHLHALLRRGLIILEELFPGFESELLAAGGVRLTGSDFLRLSAAGWAKRFDGPPLIAASRELIECIVRNRTINIPNVTVLHGGEVRGLISTADGSTIMGVQLRIRAVSPRAEIQTTPLAADFVVDASGRNSKAGDWLESLGYAQPKQTVINSFLGYASCVFAPSASLQADWRVLMVGDKPPLIPRAGALFPIEGNRWMVTLAGYAKDYPPTDREGFMEFARSLRSDLLYEAIKGAQQLSRIYGFRSTVNQRRHFEELARRPEGFAVIGDAACAFNPVYGQGMTVAAITAIALRQILTDHIKSQRLGNVAGLATRIQRDAARASDGAWLIATGADVRYPTTEGRPPRLADRLAHSYLDRVIAVSMQDAKVNEVFLRVVHLLDSPQALFRPSVALRALVGAGRPIEVAPVERSNAFQNSMTRSASADLGGS